jgi:hypothetical protein
MPVHHASPLHVMDLLGPAVGAVAFVLIMSRVREPARRRFNAVFVAGASGVYLSGGLGPWELLYPAITAPIVYLALDSHRFTGIAWLLHAGWDVVHHLWGNPIWPFMPTSSFGCMIFDALIAIWFLAGAPTITIPTWRVAATSPRVATGTSAADTRAARARPGTG